MTSRYYFNSGCDSLGSIEDAFCAPSAEGSIELGSRFFIADRTFVVKQVRDETVSERLWREAATLNNS